jgi:hypothetical protein
MEEFLADSPEKIWKCRDIVIINTDIIDVLRGYGVELRAVSSKEFSHVAKCPLPGHTGRGHDGRERTASFYISSKFNNFYCFGCSAVGSVIDLISLVEGIPRYASLKRLASKIGLLKDGKLDESVAAEFAVSYDSYDPTKSIIPHLVEISVMLRNYIKDFVQLGDFEREFQWVEQVSARVDELMANIEYEDCEYVVKLRDTLKAVIDKRR